jgi:hypothetical protein
VCPSSFRRVCSSLVKSGVAYTAILCFTQPHTRYNYPHGWELMLGLSGIPSGLQFVGMLFQIESPRWLAKRYGRDAAVKALRRVRGPDRKAVDDEVDEILGTWLRGKGERVRG